MIYHRNSISQGLDSETENNDLIFAYSDWSRIELIKKVESLYQQREYLYDRLDKKQITIDNITIEIDKMSSKITKSHKGHTCLRCGELSHKGRQCHRYRYYCKTRCKYCNYFHHSIDCNRDIKNK